MGASAFRWLVLPRAGVDADAQAKAARLGERASALLLPILIAVFALQVLGFRDPEESLTSAAETMFTIRWGHVWALNLLAAVLVLVAFRFARRGTRGAWIAAAVLSTALAFCPGLNGHAAAVETFPLLAIALDGLHVLCAGAWLGSLAIIAETSRGASGPLVLQRLRAFSPVALGCAATILVTGTATAWIHLEHFSDLTQTVYGRWLVAKLALVLCVVGLGAWNWRQATRRLAETGHADPVRRSMKLELVFAVFVLLATAVLVATSPQS
jgi:copper transport protein